MKTIQKFFAVFALAALFAMAFATPALAFDGRTGDVIVIAADEVIDDDLYVSANEFTLEGTIKGDLVVFATTVIIRGTVEGDLIAAGNTIIMEGTVTDDVRIAGAAIQFGDASVIGDDVIGASASLEARPGGSVEGDVVYAGAQALLSGSIGGNLTAAVGGLEIRGEIGGDVTAELGDVQEAGPPPSMYITDIKVSIPNVNPGLTIGNEAKINGDLTYTQSKESNIPGGAVKGTVNRKEPVVNQEMVPVPPTQGEVVANWVFDLLRSIAALAIFGLLLAWLAPAFMKGLMQKIQTQPAPSLGWGVVAYAAFFFALLLIVVVTIIAAILFGAVTLGSVTATIIWLSLLAIFALVIGFVLFTSFGSQILVAWLGGRWILGRFNSALAEHKVWPMLLGVVIVGLLVNLPLVGWIFGMLIMFFGLGALWLWGRERLQKPVAVAVP